LVKDLGITNNPIIEKLKELDILALVTLLEKAEIKLKLNK
jgi:hypothetical protein